jgi:iron complex transport system substrate-binding protein
MRLGHRRLGAPLLLLLAILSPACSGDRPAPDPAAGPIARPPHLVVVSPAAAEMLAELGLTDWIVGIGDYVTRPAELNSLPRVGPYNSPNVEKVLELQADILITARSDASRGSNMRLRDLGVDLGERLDREETADRILESLESAMTAIRHQTRGANQPTVLFVVGRDPLYIAGPGSHIDEMIRTAGGVNVAADAGSPYQIASLEAILARLPDVIIDTSDNGPDARRGRRPGPWSTWDFLPAVRNNRVFWVDPDLLVIPGMRLPAMTERMGRLIHPEIFGEPGETDFKPFLESQPTETIIEESP